LLSTRVRAPQSGRLNSAKLLHAGYELQHLASADPDADAHGNADSGSNRVADDVAHHIAHKFTDGISDANEFANGYADARADRNADSHPDTDSNGNADTSGIPRLSVPVRRRLADRHLLRFARSQQRCLCYGNGPGRGRRFVRRVRTDDEREGQQRQQFYAAGDGQ